MTRLIASPSRAVSQVEEMSRENPGPEELLGACADVIDSIVPFDGIFLSAADPVTHQFSTLTYMRELPPEMCAPWMDNEFGEDDVNKFSEMHRHGIRVSTLREATAENEWRSARYRDIYRPYGFGPELRAVLSDGRASWGFLTLVREAGAPDFSDEEVAAIDQLGVPLALALRNSCQGFPPSTPSLTRPGTFTIDRTGRFVRISDSAHGALLLISCEAPIHAVASSALAAAGGRQASPPETRLRTAEGSWLIARGDVIRDDEGQPTQATVVIEPAHSAQVTDVLTKAHGLTDREEAVLSHLARGKATRDIANALYISQHTVRDHVKSLFSKTGCRSRGELVFRYFGTSI